MPSTHPTQAYYLPYKELRKQYQKQSNSPVDKWAHALNRYFPEDIQTANGRVEKHPTSLAIGEMQIRTTLRFRLAPVRMAVTKKTINAREGVGEGTLFH